MEVKSDFDTFYEAFPRKRSRQDALKAWKQTEKVRPSLAAVLAALRVLWKQDWHSRPKDKIPYPATWLRAHGWGDMEDFEIPVVEISSAPGSPYPWDMLASARDDARVLAKDILPEGMSRGSQRAFDAFAFTKSRKEIAEAFVDLTGVSLEDARQSLKEL